MSKDEDSVYDSLLIPSYEEATSSRASSSLSQHRAGAAQDAENQGLLGRNMGEGRGSQRRHGNYRAPMVESARSSYDSALTEPELSDDDEEVAALRQDMEEMEVDDPAAQRAAQQRARLRHRFSKSLASITSTFSSLHLSSIPVSLPSFKFLTSRFPSVSDRYKPSWPIVARLVAIAFVVSLVYGVFFVRIFSPKGVNLGKQYIPESLRTFVQSHADPNRIESYLRQITADDHMAGTRGDFFLAEWVKEHFEAAQLDAVWTEDFQVYLNFPTSNGRRVAIVEPADKRWEASLEENVVDPQENPSRHQTLVFHGLSRSGNVTGPLIYANYGSSKDFKYLKDQKIDLKGAIVLVRYYGTQNDRAMKVKAAELAGAAGCLIYSDPAEDGFTRGHVWPEGPWRTPDSVQRGTVALTSWVVGDPLTPGWPSLPGAERKSKDNNPGLVNIPSLPLGWRDAQQLLKALSGHGKPVPKGWTGGIPDIKYFVGSPSSSPKVQLVNLQDESEQQPIRNILGKIEGIESPESEIYIGNHRDAWCFGSVDPGSGTAVFLEVVRIFGELMTIGWRPRRSIIFASWDAEEYNLIGSTEHVESRIDALRLRGLAYLNVDVGVSGSQFRASGAPIFKRPLHHALNRVADPSGDNVTLAQVWNEKGSRLGSLGAGSDYVAFQDLAGCSSLDFGFSAPFEADSDLPTESFPYHSCYETMDWLERFGDPNELSRHVALAQIWALLILEISDEPVLSLDLRDYAQSIWESVGALQKDVTHHKGVSKKSLEGLESLNKAAELLSKNAEKFEGFGNEWEDEVMAHSMIETRELAIQRMSHNARVGEFESHLLDLPWTTEQEEEQQQASPSENPPDPVPGDPFSGDSKNAGRKEHGLPGRRQFKHVIHGPSLTDAYDDAAFPGVRDALMDGDWPRIEEQITLAAEKLRLAATKLLH